MNMSKYIKKALVTLAAVPMMCVSADAQCNPGYFGGPIRGPYNGFTQPPGFFMYNSSGPFGNYSSWGYRDRNMIIYQQSVPVIQQSLPVIQQPVYVREPEHEKVVEKIIERHVTYVDMDERKESDFHKGPSPTERELEHILRAELAARYRGRNVTVHANNPTIYDQSTNRQVPFDVIVINTDPSIYGFDVTDGGEDTELRNRLIMNAKTNNGHEFTTKQYFAFPAENFNTSRDFIEYINNQIFPQLTDLKQQTQRDLNERHR